MTAEEPRHKSRIGERLARILSEIGYASRRKPGAVEVDRLCDVLNASNPGRRITPNMMRGYIYHGKTLSLEVAALLAKELRFNLLDLAYEERPMPVPRRQRKRVKGLLDEIEPLGGDW